MGFNDTMYKNGARSNLLAARHEVTSKAFLRPMSRVMRGCPATGRELPTLASSMRVAPTTCSATPRGAPSLVTSSQVQADTKSFLQGLWYSRHQASRKPEEVRHEENLMYRVAVEVDQACAEVRGRRQWKVGTGHLITGERIQMLASPRMPMGDPAYKRIEERQKERILSTRRSARRRKEREARQLELAKWKEARAAEKAAENKVALAAQEARRVTRAQREVRAAEQAERNMADALAYAEKKKARAAQAMDLQHTISSRRTARWGNPNHIPEPVDVMDAPPTARPMLSESSFPG